MTKAKAVFCLLLEGGLYLKMSSPSERDRGSVDTDARSLDEVAERLLAIRGEPYVILDEFKESAVIAENVDDKNLSQDKMVEAIVKDYQSIRDYLTGG